MIRALGTVKARAHHYCAQRLNLLSGELAPMVGRAWFVVATAESGERQGGLVRVDVMNGRPTSDGFSARPEVGSALNDGAALAEQARAPLVAQIWPPDAERCVSGASLQLAVAVAAWSRLSGAAIPGGVVFSGRLSADHVEAPNALEQKRATVRDELGEVGRLLTGQTAVAGCLCFESLKAMLQDGLGLLVGQPLPIADQIRWVAEAFDSDAFADAAARAGRLLQRTDGLIDGPELYHLASVRAHALARLSRSAEAVAQLREAVRWQDSASSVTRARVGSVLGIAQLDAGRLDDAAEVLDEQLDPLRREHKAGVADHAMGLTELHGTRARVCSAMGEAALAVEHGEAAVQFAPVAERARALQSLAFWCLRGGDLAACRVALDGADYALELARKIDQAAAEKTQRYVELTWARLLLAEGDVDAAMVRADGIETARRIDLTLGVAEVLIEAGAEARVGFGVIDADPALRGGVVTMATRLRARAELLRAAPNGADLRRWLGHEVVDRATALADLRVQLPY